MSLMFHVLCLQVCLYLLPVGTWSEMWPVMANVFLGMPSPLYAFQMIILCVLTDVMAAMALVHEKAERAIMLRPPVIPHKNHLVNAKLLFHAYIELGRVNHFNTTHFHMSCCQTTTSNMSWLTPPHLMDIGMCAVCVRYDMFIMWIFQFLLVYAKSRMSL